VIGTARNPSSTLESYPKIESVGGQWAALDINGLTSGVLIVNALKYLVGLTSFSLLRVT
jgi:hypothetical protein